jgi:hypothetical protein
MHPKNSKSLAFTESDSQILNETVISENAPGTILKDFNCLLDYIGSNTLEATKSKSYFSMKHLNSINERLAAPLKIALNRPQQKAFVNINGLYLLLRTMGIVKIHPSHKKEIFQLNEPIFNSWKGLNNTERYFTLLESWLLRSNPRELLGSYHSGLLLKACFEFWEEIPKNGLKVEGNDQSEEMLKYIPGFYNIALMELFGFIEIIHGAPKPGKGWRILKIKRNTYGDAIFKYLGHKVLSSEEHLYFLIDFEINKAPKLYGEWQSHFRPFFPDWQNNLAIPEPEYREGIYVFKVSLGDVWRRIEIYSDLTLEDLTDTILDSFDFDKDHHYSYYCKDLFGSMVEINSPNSYDEPFTNDVLIGEIPIHIGSSMKFLYDFGDNWEFQVTLEEVREGTKKLKHPKVIAEHGEAPDQYPDWDDEEWEFEE